jgi:hypothetical protein
MRYACHRRVVTGYLGISQSLANDARCFSNDNYLPLAVQAGNSQFHLNLFTINELSGLSRNGMAFAQ